MYCEFFCSNIIKESLKQSLIFYFNKNNFSLNNFDFKIELDYPKKGIIYKSFVCLDLGKKYQINSLILAQNIVNIFNQFEHDILAIISDNGWLEFTISDSLLNKWLQKLPLIKFSEIFCLKLAQLNDDNHLNFNLYYVHARCCSILKSAHRDNIITLNNLEFVLNQWHIINFDSICFESLISLQDYEYKLIKELLFISELLCQNCQKINLTNLIIKLSKSILDVERYCRIWGEIKKQNLVIVMARLGLIAIALHYYQNLFYSQFKLKLPTEL